MIATALKDPKLRARIRNEFYQLSPQYWDIARLRHGLARTLYEDQEQNERRDYGFATGEETTAGAEQP